MEDEQEFSVSAQSESRGQTYRKIWEMDPALKDWLQPHASNKKALCSMCESSISAHYHTLRKHARSKKHLDLMRRTSSTNSLDTVETALEIQKIVTRIKLILTGFFVEHNIAYRIVDHLIPLLKHCFQDVDVCKMLRLGRTQLTAMTSVIASSYNNKLCITLQKRKFSIMTDESTDVSNVKVICIIVRFFDAEIQRIRCALWDLIEISQIATSETSGFCYLGYRDEDSNETAENLYNNIIHSFTICNIPLENITGFGSDGCNSMMGLYNSVASRFRNDYPNITILKCICHTAHLCANYACKTLPRECEDLGRNIYNFFKLSSKRQHQFKEFQILLDAEVHKMLYSAQTRWLLLKAVVDRILEQWEPLQMYFTQWWEEQHLPAAEIIYSSITHPFMKCYYLFLEWVLPKFTKFNLLFQSEKVIIPLLYNQAAALFKDILICYMDNSYVFSTNVKDIDPDN
ncbi:zinc finger BED domain-containing protein 5-like [Prorops nasuta]|uniref:zinc finger BED domain-containing protein 5-like n=1 Tax=Prorops nasuta TaxID=863751 RepID=UPI0034CFFB0A